MLVGVVFVDRTEPSGLSEVVDCEGALIVGVVPTLGAETVGIEPPDAPALKVVDAIFATPAALVKPTAIGSAIFKGNGALVALITPCNPEIIALEIERPLLI